MTSEGKTNYFPNLYQVIITLIPETATEVPKKQKGLRNKTLMISKRKEHGYVNREILLMLSIQTFEDFV